MASQREAYLEPCHYGTFTAQKIKFSIKGFFRKCDQIHIY